MLTEQDHNSSAVNLDSNFITRLYLQIAFVFTLGERVLQLPFTPYWFRTGFYWFHTGFYWFRGSLADPGNLQKGFNIWTLKITKMAGTDRRKQPNSYHLGCIYRCSGYDGSAERASTVSCLYLWPARFSLNHCPLLIMADGSARTHPAQAQFSVWIVCPLTESGSVCNLQPRGVCCLFLEKASNSVPLQC